MISDTLRLELEPFGIKVVDLKTAVVATNLIHNMQETQKPSLPNQSIYKPAKDVVQKALRQEAFVGQGMPAAEWARAVVADLQKPKTPLVIWRGASAWLVRLSTILPFGSLDSKAKQITGMDMVAAILVGK